MPPRLSHIALIAVPLFVALPACTGDDNAGAAPPPDAGDATSPMDASDAAPTSDAGTTTDAATSSGDDAGEANAPNDSGDAGQPDAEGGPTPLGTRVAAENVVRLDDLTADGYVVYETSTTLSVVPLAGGAPTPIAIDGFNEVLYKPASRAVAIVAVSDLDNARGELAVWTAAHGLKVVASSVPDRADAIDVSPDGAHVAYVAADPNLPTVVLTGIYIAPTDGSSPPSLLRSISPAYASFCASPRVAFTAAGDLVASYCAPPDDAGANPQGEFTEVFDGATNAQKALVPGFDYGIDPSGRWLWVETATTGSVVDVSSGASIFSTALGAVTFDATGDHVFYASQTGTLLTLATATPSAQHVLVSSGCTMRGVAPNGATVLCALDGEDGGGGLELDGVSTTTPASQWTLWPNNNSGVQFTADSRYVLDTTGDGTFATPTTGGAATTVASTLSAPTLRVTHGSKFLQDFEMTLVAYDASGANPPLPVATDVYGFVTPKDGSSVAYIVQSGDAAGLYIAALP